MVNNRSSAALHRRIQLLFGRGILQSVSDSVGRQFVQIRALAGETKDGVERVQQYGISCVPLAGAQVLFIAQGGNRDHPVVFAVDDPRYRPKDLLAGEVVIYTDEGDKIYLKRGNVIEVETVNFIVKASEKVRLETPRLECTGDIIDRVDGEGITINEMRDIYDTHTHTGDSGGSTSAPHQLMED